MRISSTFDYQAAATQPKMTTNTLPFSFEMWDSLEVGSQGAIVVKRRKGEGKGDGDGIMVHLAMSAREEDRGVRMEYSVGRMGSEELGRKTRVLTITVSVLPDFVLISVAEY
jgi:hypothetical protein